MTDSKLIELATPSKEAREAAADCAQTSLEREGMSTARAKFITNPIRAGKADKDCLVQAFHRFQLECEARQIERCAKVAERDVHWTRFGQADLDPWEGGADGYRDYRLGIIAGRSIAAAIRQQERGQ